jgi:hypothetical protein
VQIPTDPGSDGIDRGDFVTASLSLTAPGGLGVASARVKFGYAEQGAPTNYYGTSRRETTVSVSSTISDSNAFSYLYTDSFSPQPCSLSCTLAIPVVPLHTAYYLVEFLDSGGSVVSTSQGVAMENNIVALALGSSSAVFKGISSSTGISAGNAVQQ